MSRLVGTIGARFRRHWRLFVGQLPFVAQPMRVHRGLAGGRFLFGTTHLWRSVAMNRNASTSRQLCANREDGYLNSRSFSNRQSGNVGHSANLFRRLCTDNSGVAAVEMAIVAPLLMILVMGTIEFGLLFVTLNSVQSGIRDTARQISVNFLTVGEAQAAVRGFAPNWSQSDVDVTVTESNPGNPEQNTITVRASMMASEATPFTFVIDTIGDFALETEVSMRQELPF